MTLPDDTNAGGRPFTAPGYGQPEPGGYDTQAGSDTQAGRDTQAGYAAPSGYGAAPGGYGTPPAYGDGGVVGPGGEWLGPPLASWGLRVASYLIDGILVGVVVVLANLVSSSLSQVVNLAAILLLGYLNGATGQTPGKRAVGTKVLRVTDGQVLGAGAGIGRQFLHILDLLPVFLGFLWPIWDKKKQTLADKIIGSVVVKL